VFILGILLKSYIVLITKESAGFQNNTIEKKINFSNTGHNLDKGYTDEQKAKRISFLKVTKSGSSTVACIFIRFGINNNLSMFLPKQPIISEKEQNLLLRENKQFDIYIIHTFYNYNFFTHIVYNPNIIGLIRRPETRLISHAFFFSLFKKYRSLRGLNDQDFINKVVENTERYKVNNVMGRYFGLHDTKISEESLQEQLFKLNSEFKLVLILEMLDESLIILKRLFRWSVFDIIYSAKKTRHHENVHINASQIRHLKLTNNIEYAIYKVFNEELVKKIQNAGEDFMQEVARFKHILSKSQTFCSNQSNTGKHYFFKASDWDDSFTLSERDCKIIFEKDVSQLKKGRYTYI
jgi:hypothetical protein